MSIKLDLNAWRKYCHYGGKFVPEQGANDNCNVSIKLVETVGADSFFPNDFI